MAYHYYIYYRVMPGQIAHVAEQAARLLHRVAALTGIAGKIRRRSDETATFLEIYEGVSDRARFERWLLATLERLLFEPAQATRHPRKTIRARRD